MIARMLILAAQAATATSAAPVPLAPPPDWSRLPPLVLRRPVPQAPEAAAFVAGEVKAGRCVQTGSVMTVDLALLASASGQVKRIVPRAIDCPTVEQYAAGILLSMARSNVDVDAAGGEGWYRTSLTFTWGP